MPNKNQPDNHEQHIYNLDIGTRAKNALVAAGITEAWQVQALTEYDLRRIPGIGNKTIWDIEKGLRSHNLRD